MKYSADMKVAVVSQIIAMFDNNILNDNGIEHFEGWCEDGKIFEQEDSKSPKFVKGCIDLMREVSPLVDEISTILETI